MADQSNPFWLDMERHYSRLSPGLGINLEYFWPVPTGDPEAQARMLLDMLPLGFDLIVLNPLNNHNLAPGILAAAEQHVPLLDVGAKTNPELVKEAGSYYIPVPTVNFYEQGRLGAQYICNQLKAEKTYQVAILEGRPDSTQSLGRSRGASDCFNSHPCIQSIRTHQADFDRQKARAVSKGLFEDDPGIEAVFCVNDLMALGVADAVKELKLETQPIIVGVDLIDEARGAIKKGEISASVDFSREEVAVSILKLGREYMETMQTPVISPVLSRLVHRNNVEDYDD